MLKSIFCYNKRKVLGGFLFALILLILLSIVGENLAQNLTPKDMEKMKSIQIINPNPTFSLRLRLDKARSESFTPGEKIIIYFKSTRDAFVTLYNYDTLGQVRIIFPNRYSPHNFLKAGQEYKVEGQIAPDTQAGIEFVQGFATTRPLLVNESVKNMISKQFMPQVSSEYRSFVLRIKSIILPLPPTEWTSSNLLSFNVIPVMPPPVNYGRIVVNSNPPASKVYLDDIYRGITPLSLDTLNTGYHYIKLTKPGYEDWIKKVYVYSSKTTNVFADLAPLLKLGLIAVSCNKSNAKIYLDGDYKKRTSSSKTVMLEDIKEGYHELSITKTGYNDWSEKVYVSTAQVTNVYVNLVKPVDDGSISVYCNQGSAKIYLDGKYKRKTSANKSVELKNIKAGYHELLITKDGYQDWVNTIMITANQTYMVSAYLTSEISHNGSIAVYCNVSGAKIFVNGIYKAATSSSQPKILEEFRERAYEITIIKDGYRTWVEDIWVYTGEATSIYVELKEIDL
ncbi:MAG: PEGA domain-containing protein [Candidatus Caldatribacteriota bacterium]|nr:PEGA domain-containing protein [Candidatus Caldatribacteriota bacterium]